MSATIEAGARIDDITPFGSYPLPLLIKVCLSITQRLPLFYLFRRLGFFLRKLVFWNVPLISDATVGSLSLRLYPRDNVTERQYLFLPQFQDHWEHAFIKTHLPKDGTFVDLGANIGVYSLWALEILGKKGKVLACEPHPAIRRRLLFNLSLNSKKANITVLPQATSDKIGTFRLYFDPLNWGASSLVRHQEFGQFVEVKTEPLLNLIQKAGLSQIDILKADIEGAEDRTLIPFFDQAPKNVWPRHLIIENSKDEWGQDLFSVLETLGYTLQRMNRMNVTWSLNKFS